MQAVVFSNCAFDWQITFYNLSIMQSVEPFICWRTSGSRRSLTRRTKSSVNNSSVEFMNIGLHFSEINAHGCKCWVIGCLHIVVDFNKLMTNSFSERKIMYQNGTLGTHSTSKAWAIQFLYILVTFFTHTARCLLPYHYRFSLHEGKACWISFQVFIDCLHILKHKMSFYIFCVFSSYGIWFFNYWNLRILLYSSC